MTGGAVARGLRNPFRSRARAAIVVGLLGLVTGLCALMVQAIEGIVTSTKLTRCEMKPGTCEGSLVLENRAGGTASQVTIQVRTGTAIKKGDDHLFLPGLKGQPVVISITTEKGERVAKSIEVKTAKP